MSRSNLAGMVVVVTGASSGIGAATALLLARRGARVVLVARGAPALDRVAQRCRDLGGSVLVAPADVADPKALDAVADRAVSAFGRLDGWVNNAAVGVCASLADVPLDQFRRVMETNLTGVLNGYRAALPHLREAGAGVIVNVASLLGEVSAPYQGAYVASKHAVRGLSASMRQETRLAGDGVSVCTVLPWSVDTPFFRHAANRTGRRPRPIPPALAAQRVAAAIAEVLVRPRREAYVGVSARILGLSWRVVPALLERLAAPATQRVGFAGSAPDTLGALFAPVDSRADVSGGWLTGVSSVTAVFAAARRAASGPQPMGHDRQREPVSP
jgi:NAD(P)-dependent dehydrogenase (short-subunit alcohol dehydrogenase family)